MKKFIHKHAYAISGLIVTYFTVNLGGAFICSAMELAGISVGVAKYVFASLGLIPLAIALAYAIVYILYLLVMMIGGSIKNITRE